MDSHTSPNAAIPLRREERGAGFRCVSVEAGSLACEDFRAAPGLPLGAHAHPSAHFCFVLEGRLAERDGGSERILGPGELRASPPGDEHRLRIAAEGVRCLLLFAEDPVIAGSGLPPPGRRRFLAGRAVQEIGRRLAREMARPDDASPVVLEMLTLELLALLRRSEADRPEGPPTWLARTRERLEDRPERCPTLAELAEDAGVSRAHLARAFRGHFGCTVGDYVRSLRVEAARRLILGTDLALARVAYRAGFADQSHMTRLLGARIGVPPAKLRAEGRRES